MIHLLGAGGHCKVVLDALLMSGVSAEGITIRDGDVVRCGEKIFGIEVRWPEFEGCGEDDWIHVSVGSGAARERLYALAAVAGFRLLSIRHPAAHVSPSAMLEDGSFVAAGAIVAPGATVGAATIVNHNAVVDHDCDVGSYCHIAPAAVLGGGVKLADRVFVGAGAVVLPGLHIGAGSIVGAGAVVAHDIGSDEVWAGVPAGKLTAK